MAVNDHTVSSRQLAARWSNATGVLMSASSIRRLLLHHDSRFKLGDYDGRIRVRCYAGERCLPDCGVERLNGLIPEIMVWGTISYHEQSSLLRIESNLNSAFVK
ncbi:hypothetical protein TNCV_3874551 [Trichonephila clavipes]|nr:hypothetical protein TNCV_3874551 [Trichonephila clavipes]